MSMAKFAVGKTLWFQSSVGYVPSGAVTITKVGRTWLTLDNSHRADIETLVVEGVNVPAGRCFMTYEECEAEQQLRAEWRMFTQKINQWTPPTGLTLESLQEAKRLLFGESAS